MGPNPLTILSTNSKPKVRLSVPHCNNDGSPSIVPDVSPTPATSKQRSSRRRYASLAAGRSLIEVGSVGGAAESAETEASCSGAGMSTLKEAMGRAVGSVDLATRESSSATRSKTNMKSCLRVAEAVEATTGILEVESRCDKSRACHETIIQLSKGESTG